MATSRESSTAWWRPMLSGRSASQTSPRCRPRDSAMTLDAELSAHCFGLGSLERSERALLLLARGEVIRVGALVVGVDGSFLGGAYGGAQDAGDERAAPFAWADKDLVGAGEQVVGQAHRQLGSSGWHTQSITADPSRVHTATAVLGPTWPKAPGGQPRYKAGSGSATPGES